MIRGVWPLTAACVLWPVVTLADDTPAEIEYLLEAIGSSACMFIRNGERHAATEAESHLRMKYRRAVPFALLWVYSHGRVT